MRSHFSFTAAGDFLVQRHMPETYPGFPEVRDFICRGDFRFFNLETVFTDETCYGSQFYGGAYLRADPEVLQDTLRYGFNMLTLANNHSMDFAYNGLLRTLDTVRAAGVPYAGAGRNLDEAAAPAYLETEKGSMGLIGITSSMTNVAALAGRQSRRFPGRPGVNGLRHTEELIVTPEQFEAFREAQSLSHIDAQDDIARSEGFRAPLKPGSLCFHKLNVTRGEKPAYLTHPNEIDMARMEQSIQNARKLCDYVIVSAHSHELGGPNKEIPAQFFVEFAHRCIDAGASAFVGHGPHLIRPIEIYHGKPIFYCLGNFVFQDEVAVDSPEDQYTELGLTSDAMLSEIYVRRTKDHTAGLCTDRRVYEAFLPYVELENDEVTRIDLYPISLGFDLPRYRTGYPEPGFGLGILERLQTMSAPYGTRISIDESGLGHVDL
ncbi:MAG: CapA family protein [Lachnospiraceae bacterium]|nr:CapA family protein [Lachnospiraceae bacterium]